MIPKAEREKDKAALAALPSYIEIDEDGSIWDCPGQGAHVARVGDASDADIRPALAHAVNRLPKYIVDAAEMERRISAIEIQTASFAEEAEEDDDDESYGAGYRKGILEALRILRGEK